MKSTKIDWCDCTINPVIGCKNGCQYCYAKKINKRFNFIKDWEEPKFFPGKLTQLKTKKTKTIFMDSMSDVGFWEEDWLNETIKAMQNNPQHKYIFLTKCTNGFISHNRRFFYGLLDNKYFGISITKQKDLEKICCNHNFDFISIEPILEEIKLNTVALYPIKQIIIGAETGNRKGKIIPKKIWVEKIIEIADQKEIKVFMKSSLKNLMGDDFRQDKLIWEAN